jgi:hypothetical protein
MREQIFKDIEAERKYQDEKWGRDFDDKNTTNDWAAYIVQYLGNVIKMPYDKQTVRKGMLKVATLAVAALERIDSDTVAKRHYD